VFDVLGENFDDYVSLAYFRWYDPSIDRYYVCLKDLPRKVIGLHYLILLMIFLRPLIRLRGYLLSLV